MFWENVIGFPKFNYQINILGTEAPSLYNFPEV